MGAPRDVAGIRVHCLPSTVSVALALASPADAATSPPARPSPAVAALPDTGLAPLKRGGFAGAVAPASTLPSEGVDPLRAGASARYPAPPTPSLPTAGAAPLDGSHAGAAPSTSIESPFRVGPATTVDRPDPRKLRVVRIDLLVGPVWRIRPTEALFLASVEAGRLRGFSGLFNVGMILAPDRDFVGVHDFPIGAGFVARRPLGRPSLSGSVGLSAGILVHRATTNLGVVHRVDPDLQLPLKFAWTAGSVGLSLAVLQGFSVRERAYYRRGVEVWQRIAYRVGFAIGLHFEIGAGRAQSRRAARREREMP